MTFLCFHIRKRGYFRSMSLTCKSIKQTHTHTFLNSCFLRCTCNPWPATSKGGRKKTLSHPRTPGAWLQGLDPHLTLTVLGEVGSQVIAIKMCPCHLRKLSLRELRGPIRCPAMSRRWISNWEFDSFPSALCFVLFF